MRKLLFAVAVAALTWLSPAHADWQFTKWGQSPADVLSMRDKGVRALSAAESERRSYPSIGRALLIAPYKTADSQTEAEFYFRDNRLSGVSVNFRNEQDAFTALSRLRAQYGASTDVSRTSSPGCDFVRERWRDAKRGNDLAYTALSCAFTPGVFRVIYTPILKAEDTGL